MPSFSPWAYPEDLPPKWLPGEEIIAAAFIGATLYLVVEINFEVLRAFRKRSGLYFWAIEIGSWGIAMDIVGAIVKYFVPNTTHLWPLYTLFVLLSWSVYSVCQNLILYSRLHLVLRNKTIERCVLVMILSTIVTFILPTWICAWPAFNPDPRISSVWSPREAIVERYQNLGFTIVESIISGIYIWTLSKLLSLKPELRQQRVFLDLILVNLLVITFDIIVVVLVYLNQTNVSHVLQSFSYALKLRLEFVVLNQLMAVAARGLQPAALTAEKRYYHPSTSSNVGSSAMAKLDSSSTEVPFSGSQRAYFPGNNIRPTFTPTFQDNKSQPALASKKEDSRGRHGDEDGIDLHMWERAGKLQAPWLNSPIDV
ncbi:hypothetical protein MMC20_004061 [Loxospora ochrophaea]|nr:hypothetical protein [Loxospora ochrophaea]